MSEYDYFQCIPMAVFDTATLAETYAALNGSGFGDDIKILKIYNAGTIGITISYDNGVTDHDFYPSGATQIIDLQSNHPTEGNYAKGTKVGRKGQIIMGKRGVATGAGNLYIIGYR